MSLGILSGKRLVLLLLAIILIYDLVHSIIYTLGPTELSEDFAYFFLALGALHGQVSLSNFNIDGTRLLQYLPMALFYKLFGVNIYSSSAWNIIMFMGTVLVAFFVGKRVYNANAGLLAALLISFFTPAVKNSITAGISEAMMFFVSITMLAMLYAHDKKSPKLMFVTGVLAIATQLTIPIGIIAILAVLLYAVVEFLRRNLSMKLIAWLIIGMIVAVLPIIAFSYINTGNPLVVIHENSEYYSNLSMTYTTYGIIGTPPKAYANYSGNDLAAYLLFYPRNMFTSNILQALRTAILTKNLNPLSIWSSIYHVSTGNAGFYFYAVFIAALILLILGERRLYFPLFWFAVGIGFLEFAPMSVSFFPFRYMLIFRAMRYTSSIAVPIAVILSIAIMRIVEGSGIGKGGNVTKKELRKKHSCLRLLAGSVIVVFLIATAIPINNAWYDYAYTQTYPLHVIANLVNSMSNSTYLYIPSGDFYFLSVYMHQNNMSRVIMYDNIRNCSVMKKGAYVVIANATSGFDPDVPYINNTTEECPSWKLVMEVHASPQITAYSGWPELRYEQMLYYVS
jgi:4-amino-4-deoxy-L-arabinose transferase-like glycosyltransferase